jgi:hypothetical protein
MTEEEMLKARLARVHALLIKAAKWASEQPGDYPPWLYEARAYLEAEFPGGHEGGASSAPESK